MSLASRLSWAGAGVLGAGLVVGWLPVSSRGSECGSAFSPRWLRPLSCDDLLSLVRIPAVLFTVAGVLLLAVAVAAALAKR